MARRKAPPPPPKRNARTLTLLTAAVVLAVVLIGLFAFDRRPQEAPILAGDFELERQPMMGDPEAPVEMLVFEDFKCPACRNFEESVMPRLQRDYVDSGVARLYFINFQFIAPDSVTAGIAAECAYRQDAAAFWDYKTYVYRAQGSQQETWATPQLLVSIARDYVPALDATELEACIIERRHEDLVLRDRQLAQNAGISSTPTVLVNGEQVSSPTYEAVSAAIEAHLAQAD
jgi:protein-disulfide isomerase